MVSEVSTQVAEGITKQQPNIQKAILDQTSKAVAGLQPTIASAVAAEVGRQIRISVAPVQARLASSNELIRVGSLAILAQNDQRPAYEELETLSRSSTNPDVRAISATSLNAVNTAHNHSFFATRQFKTPVSKEQVLGYLKDPNPYNRVAAVDTLNGYGDRSNVQFLIDLIEKDPDLTVVEHAFRGFNTLTANSVTILDFDSVRKWRQEHRSDFK